VFQVEEYQRELIVCLPTLVNSVNWSQREQAVAVQLNS
jgi:hypothetical protein